MTSSRKEYEDEIIEVVAEQFSKIPKLLETTNKPMFFYLQPLCNKKHLTFKFLQRKKIKPQIKEFLTQANVHFSYLKEHACHFEYFDNTNQWVVIDLNTTNEDFPNDTDYHEIRLRYH